MSLPAAGVVEAQPGSLDSIGSAYSEAELAGFLAAATEIAREAGALVAASYDQGHQEDQKGHAHNLVTETDRASEALIVDRLRSRFPRHGIRAEEGGGSEAPAGGGSEAPAGGGSEALASGIVWVVDPLDGTNNFAHGLPIFAVSMAAMAGEVVLAGVTYDPLRDELFAARLGGGAWLNGRRLAVSKREHLESSIVATGFPYDKASNPDNNLAQFAAVTPRVRGIRRLGSAALDLAYVAAGRMEAYWERGTYAWDVAAGVLMVQEAGGWVSDYAGRPARVDGGQFLASNARIHAELQAVLAAVGP